MSLTHEGRTFQHAAERALDAIEEVDAALQDVGATVSGILRVHVDTLNFAEYLLAPILPKFLARHPGLKLELLMRADFLDVTKEEYDLSLRRGPVSNPSLVAKHITSSHWLLCASPEYLAKAGMPQHPEDLSAHNCLNFLPQMRRSQWPLTSAPDAAHLHPTGSISTNSENMLRRFAIDGLGIACLADFHVRADIQAGHLVTVLPEFTTQIPEKVFAVFQSRRNLSPRVRAFLSFLEDEL